MLQMDVQREEDRNWGMLAHLGPLAGAFVGIGGIVVAVILYLMKKDQSPYIDFQLKQSVWFQIFYLGALIVFGILSFAIIGIPFLIATLVMGLVYPIIGAIKAYKLEDFEYPWIGKLIRENRLPLK